MRGKIVVLAGLVAGLAGAGAQAADLPPLPVLDESEDSLVSGWYLRGDIGLDRPVLQHGRDLGTEAVPPLVKGRFDRETAIGGGIGLRALSILRADLTVDRRFGADIEGARYGEGPSLAFDRAGFEATTVLANAYLDLPFWKNVTPYLGAGIGVSFNRFEGARRVVDGASTVLPSHGQTALAWALTGGAAFAVAPHLKLDVAYRYTHLGWARTGLDGAEPPIRARSVGAHEIRIGARYLFD